MDKRPLVLLAVLFAGPLVLAGLVYFGPFGAPPTLSNPERELIAGGQQIPAVALPDGTGGSLPATWARYRWSLIYARMAPCAQGCADDLARLAQVYLALGEDRGRVQRVFLAGAETGPLNGGPTLIVGSLAEPGSEQLVRLLGREQIEQGRIFIVDPLGNLVAAYPPDADQDLLLKDLQRLLDVSRVG